MVSDTTMSPRRFVIVGSLGRPVYRRFGSPKTNSRCQFPHLEPTSRSRGPSSRAIACRHLGGVQLAAEQRAPGLSSSAPSLAGICVLYGHGRLQRQLSTVSPGSKLAPRQSGCTADYGCRSSEVASWNGPPADNLLTTGRSSGLSLASVSWTSAAPFPVEVDDARSKIEVLEDGKRTSAFFFFPYDRSVPVTIAACLRVKHLFL
jgi:hypothetical protein